MANLINRRNWIRSSALMAGGLTVLPGMMDKLVAAPAPKTFAPEDLHGYISDKDAFLKQPAEIKVRLSANENPFGPSPAAKKAIAESIDMSYQYPFLHMGIMSGKIAAHEGITQSNILMDSGSTPLLMAAAMLYGKNGAEIITGDPSYADLPSVAAKLGSKWVKVPVTADYKLDLDAMEAKIGPNTGLVYICNPNNPTATVLDTEKLKAFCERVSKKVPVFVDEAYIDYLPDPQGSTMISAVKSGQNVIVARTFSKLYGFAGLRLGYVVAQPDTIATLSKYTTHSMSISAPTLAGAIAAYQEKDFLQDALKKTLASKDYLYSVLKAEGYEYVPSFTNFVLFPIKMDGMRFVQEMANRGVSIRNWKFNNKDYCRVSIGRMDEMQGFAAAFKQLS